METRRGPEHISPLSGRQWLGPRLGGAGVAHKAERRAAGPGGWPGSRTSVARAACCRGAGVPSPLVRNAMASPANLDKSSLRGHACP